MSNASNAGLALAAIGLAMSGSAGAATQSAFDYVPAANACQGALPAFAGTLRARPLAIGNEGTSNAFVTCGLVGTEPNRGKVITRVFVRLGNDPEGSSSISVTCTLVHGFGGSAVDAVYVPKTVTVAAGSTNQIEFTPADLGAGATLRYPQISCALPQGGLVHYAASFYTYEIGT